MSKDDKVLRVPGGYIWPIASVDDRPQILLSTWRLYEISAAWSAVPTRHLVGWADEAAHAQVSSAVEQIDPAQRGCVTRSGRLYRLIGAPGSTVETAFVWDTWKVVNGVKGEREVTDDLFRAFDGANNGVRGG